jgi:D-aminoacyl-tRNA deacylase
MLDQESVESEPDALDPRPDLAIFATRHKSASGTPCLTAHSPGNICDEALQGGEGRRVSMAAPHALGMAVRALWRRSKDTQFQVTLEATHHGPLTDVPCFFIEIGSQESHWVDQRAGETVAKAIMDVVTGDPLPVPVAVGVGGPHYSPRFTQLLLTGEIALSHIVPKHQTGALDDEMVEQVFRRSEPRAQKALLEWKGIRGQERRAIIASLEKAGLDYSRLKLGPPVPGS